MFKILRFRLKREISKNVLFLLKAMTAATFWLYSIWLSYPLNSPKLGVSFTKHKLCRNIGHS